MKSKLRNFGISDMYCTNCGNKGLSVPRMKNSYRESGHLKKIFCCECKKETNHVECKGFGKYTYENFKEEFELGRFVNGERLPIADLEDCRDRECYYNKHGKCWNSNYSFMCDKRKGNSYEA
ncbi:MAG: ribosome associated inhibitor A [Caudoviricetes sp.]|nr:MAG: ribosome associated inhibitor A [Caudoviricetes sp.]